METAAAAAAGCLLFRLPLAVPFMSDACLYGLPVDASSWGPQTQQHARGHAAAWQRCVALWPNLWPPTCLHCLCCMQQIPNAHAIGVTAVSWAPAVPAGSMVGSQPPSAPVKRLCTAGCDNTVKVGAGRWCCWQRGCWQRGSGMHGVEGSRAGWALWTWGVDEVGGHVALGA